MSLFDTVKDDDIVTDIMNLDISNMTPIDALNTLYKLQGKLRTAGKTRRLNSSAPARAVAFASQTRRIMNLLDIIGPVMVGPSSSHTAGAVKIGRVCHKLLAEKGGKGRYLFSWIISGNRKRTWNG